MSDDALNVDYRPRLPADYRPGIGIIGCGGIVKSAHLKAYSQHDLNVVGVYDKFPAATEGVQEQFGVKNIFGELDGRPCADDGVGLILMLFSGLEGSESLVVCKFGSANHMAEAPPLFIGGHRDSTPSVLRPAIKLNWQALVHSLWRGM